MFALMLRRHLPFILSATAATLFIALSAIVALLGPQQRDAQALGDPNAARPAAAAEPGIVGQPPVARPAPLPAAALAAPGGGEPANLIEARMPDARLRPAAVAAVQCALADQAPTHDPALDDVALARAGASADSLDAAIAARRAVAQEHRLVVWGVLSGFAADHTPDADPCRFAGQDLRAALTLPEWKTVRAVGVAFFAEPSATAPVSTLIVVGR